MVVLGCPSTWHLPLGAQRRSCETQSRYSSAPPLYISFSSLAPRNGNGEPFNVGRSAELCVLMPEVMRLGHNSRNVPHAARFKYSFLLYGPLHTVEDFILIKSVHRELSRGGLCDDNRDHVQSQHVTVLKVALHRSFVIVGSGFGAMT